MTDYTEPIRSLRNCSNNRCTPCDCGWFDKYQVNESCKEIIMWKAADAIEALQEQLPKLGEWVYNDGDYIPYCSICGMPQDTETPYCHFCGAKMMEVQND